MSNTTPQVFEFTCRKCGRSRKATFAVYWKVTPAEAARKAGYKNTRYGAQCEPNCATNADKFLADKHEVK